VTCSDPFGEPPCDCRAVTQQVEHLGARGRARTDADVGFAQPECGGEKPNKRLVGGAPNRRGGQAHLQRRAAARVADHPAQRVSVGPRRHPHSEADTAPFRGERRFARGTRVSSHGGRCRYLLRQVPPRNAFDGPVHGGRLQPRGRAVADVVAARDVGQRFPAAVAAPDRLAPPVCGQLRFPSELHAARLGPLAPSAVRARIRSRSNSASPLSTVSLWVRLWAQHVSPTSARSSASTPGRERSRSGAGRRA
jgi:hypothetical protein